MKGRLFHAFAGVTASRLCLLSGGPVCPCAKQTELCENRVTQRGLAVRVELLTTDKGWAAVAGEDIALGVFVCEYAGELLTSPEADRRLADYDSAGPGTVGHALLVVREVLPLRRSVSAAEH